MTTSSGGPSATPPSGQRRSPSSWRSTSTSFRGDPKKVGSRTRRFFGCCEGQRAASRSRTTGGTSYKSTGETGPSRPERRSGRHPRTATPRGNGRTSLGRPRNRTGEGVHTRPWYDHGLLRHREGQGRGVRPSGDWRTLDRVRRSSRQRSRLAASDCPWLVGSRGRGMRRRGGGGRLRRHRDPRSIRLSRLACARQRPGDGLGVARRGMTLLRRRREDEAIRLRVAGARRTRSSGAAFPSPERRQRSRSG